MISFYCIVLFNIILLCQSYNINSNSKRINFNNDIKGMSNNRNLRIYLRNDNDYFTKLSFKNIALILALRLSKIIYLSIDI